MAHMTQAEIKREIARLNAEIQDIMIIDIKPEPGVDGVNLVMSAIKERQDQIQELRKQLI